MFQESIYKYTSGKSIALYHWYDHLSNNFGELTVTHCAKTAQNCTAFHGDIGHLSRPQTLKQAIAKKQPSNAKNNLCVGVMFSYDLLFFKWVTIPCNETFFASFVCEKLPDIFQDYQLFPTNITTSFSRRVVKRHKIHVFLTKPSVNCLYPWLAGKQTCALLFRAKRPDVLSIKELSLHCDSINASLFKIPKVYSDLGTFVLGVDSNRDNYETLKTYLEMMRHEAFIMALEQNYCAMHSNHFSEVIIGNCSNFNTAKMPDPILVACIK